MGERLRQLRSIKGLTQKIVAQSLGISMMAYCHYENGDREPSIEMLIKLCDFYDVSSDYLIGRSDSY